MNGVDNSKLMVMKTRIMSEVRENLKTTTKTRVEMVKMIKQIIKEQS